MEWLTIVSAEKILRGVLARTSPPASVVALRYAQMVTFTPLQLTHSEDVVPVISAGLPADQPPAHFSEGFAQALARYPWLWTSAH